MDRWSENVVRDVRAELANDPRRPYADEIAVDAYLGAVTLRGTMGSFAQRRAAVAAASPRPLRIDQGALSCPIPC
jgi:osmotically-inducible protein OsmY